MRLVRGLRQQDAGGWMGQGRFFGLKEPKRLDLCPQCAAYVAWFIEDGCKRDYKRGERVVKR